MPNIGKVFEVIINKRLVSFCQEKNIIPESQFGFKYKHSCIHAITKLVSDIYWSLNDKHCVGACLIDVEKAFDTVWREALIYKLLKKGFNKNLIKMIWNMIEERTFVISNKGKESSMVFQVKNGL